MKKSSIYIPILAVTLTATLTTGCKKELRSQITPGKEVTVTLPGITIQQEQFVWPDFQTTAASTVVTAGEGTYPFTVELVPPTAEDSLKAQTKANVSFTNLWVFQFGTDKNLVASEKVDAVAAGEDITVTLTSGEGYIIGLIANAPDDFSSSGVTNLDQFHEALFSHASINPDALPYVGEVSGVTVKDGGIVEIAGQDVPTIMVQRVTAEINLNLTYNVTGYTLDGVEMYNVPLNGVYQPSTAVYPTEAASNFTYTDNTATGFAPQKKDEGAGTATETKKYTWYIHANQRGSVSSITTQQDKNSTTAPRYATYLRVKTHLTSNSFYELYYDIYLGENMLSDFNVKGNHTYTFNTRIAGFGEIHQNLPQQDKRVTYRPLNVIISPITDEIPQEGQTYTVTINSEKAWDAPIKIRAVNAETNEPIIEPKDIEYNAGSQGGSTQITIPANNAEQLRLIRFDYQVVGQWLQAILIQQQGTMIDIGTGFLLMAKDPHIALPWVDAVAYCKNQGDGWRLPTHNEMMLLNCLTPTLSDDQKFNPASAAPYYWTCTEYTPKATTEAWYGDPTGGNILYASINGTNAPYVKTYSLSVRCVKSKENTSTQFPKIDISSDNTQGVIITLREGNTGFPTSMLFSQRLDKTVTTIVNSGTEYDENHLMSRKFRVQKSAGKTYAQSMNLPNAISYCDALIEEGYSDWRVPSIRELMMIWILGANDETAQGDIDNSNSTSWPVMHNNVRLTDATGFSSFGPYYYTAAAWQTEDFKSSWSVSFSTGLVGIVSSTNVRCVRDEEW